MNKILIFNLINKNKIYLKFIVKFKANNFYFIIKMINILLLK